jgi:hypothetical protein
VGKGTHHVELGSMSCGSEDFGRDEDAKNTADLGVFMKLAHLTPVDLVLRSRALGVPRG